jgi:hypothetical protein
MEGHDTTFLITSAFSVDSGIRPKTVYRNLAPAELYEMVSALLNCCCLKESRVTGDHASLLQPASPSPSFASGTAQLPVCACCLLNVVSGSEV